MKVVFVYKAVESFGLEFLSALLKEKGHQTALAFSPDLFGEFHYIRIPFLHRLLESDREVVEKILRERPGLIGFSVPTVYYQWALRIAKHLREEARVPIVFGGIHPSSVPEVVLENEFVDFVVVGEGDHALLELVQALEEGRDPSGIGNLWFRRDGKTFGNPLRKLIQNLDSLPIPDKTLFEEEIPFNYVYKTTTSRGCPYSCSYCCHSILKKIYTRKERYMRRRSPGHILAELKRYKRRYNFKIVHFDDDVFTGSKRWLAEFLPLFKKEIGLNFSCVSHPLCMNLAKARMLKEAGCFLVELGTQSMRQKTRREVLNRRETNEEIERALSALDEAGLNFQVDHMLGIPGDDEAAHLLAVAEYVKHPRLARVECFSLTYHPRLEITRLARELKFIDEKREREVDEGKERMFFYGGSTTDRNLARFNRSFIALFKLIPIAPKGLIDFIVRRRWYRWFHLLPNWVVFFFELFRGAKVKDYRVLYYGRYYARQLIRRIFGTTRG